MKESPNRPAPGRILQSMAVATAALALATASCSVVLNADNGPVKTEQRDVSGFTRISVGGGSHLTVTTGSGFHVEITAEEGVLAKLDSRVEGDRLVIDARESYSTLHGVEVKVTMPELAGMELSGGATGNASQVATDRFEMIVSGGSQATISGTATSVSVQASGGSQAHLRDLSATTAQVDASGGSRVEVSASQTVSGTASGGSGVDAWGGASLTVSTSGGSSASSH